MPVDERTFAAEVAGWLLSFSLVGQICLSATRLSKTTWPALRGGMISDCTDVAPANPF